MLIPTDDVLNCIASLNKQNSREWNIYKNWFASSYMVQTAMMVDSDSTEQRTMFAGRCRELREILHYFDNAARIVKEKEDKGASEVEMPLTFEEAAQTID